MSQINSKIWWAIIPKDGDHPDIIYGDESLAKAQDGTIVPVTCDLNSKIWWVVIRKDNRYPLQIHTDEVLAKELAKTNTSHFFPLEVVAVSPILELQPLQQEVQIIPKEENNNVDESSTNCNQDAFGTIS